MFPSASFAAVLSLAVRKEVLITIKRGTDTGSEISFIPKVSMNSAPNKPLPGFHLWWFEPSAPAQTWRRRSSHTQASDTDHVFWAQPAAANRNGLLQLQGAVYGVLE